MTERMKTALQALEESDASCAVVTKSGKLLLSHENGIRPVLGWLAEDPELLKGACAADRVVGKAAALLMLYGGVTEVHAKLISKIAADLLKRREVPFSYGEMIPFVLNREGNGVCPMEKRCMSLESPEEAYKIFSRVAGKAGSAP